MTNKKIKIYTKTGDKGSTALFGGKRVQKNSQRVTTYGSLDELNAAIGLAKSFVKDKKINTVLVEIQNNLFNIGAELANPGKVGEKVGKVLRLPESKIVGIEKTIDKVDVSLPALSNFILPGGSVAAASLHLARSICRRTERETVNLAKKERVNPNILSYLNRLSDLLFVLARYANKKSGAKEIIWKKA